MRTRTSSKKSLTDQAAEIVEAVSPHVEAARERIVNDYLPAAQTALAEAREAAQDAAVQVEKSTRKSRKKAAKRARAKARDLVDTAVAAAPAGMPLVDKVQEKTQGKPKRKKRFLLLLALVGAGAIVVKRLRGEAPASYAPPRPAPAPRPAPTPPVAEHLEPDPQPDQQPNQQSNPVAEAEATAMTDAGPGAVTGAVPDEGSTDAGGAFLDEVLADADEHPGKVTTPDQPADVEDVSEPGRRKA